MAGGWIKLHRSALDTVETQEPDAFRFWMWLLLNATHAETRVYRGKGGRPVDLQPGQLVISTANGVDGLSRKRTRSLIERFTNAGMISCETRRDTGHTITIVKWLKYQQETDAGAIQGPSKGTYKGHTKAIQRPSKGQQHKNDKNDKNDSMPVEEPADLSKPPPLRERYPPFAKLPMNGKGKHYPAEYEAAWRAYPTRREDTKPACYKHWRRWVVEQRVDPGEITMAAERCGRNGSAGDYQIGFRRWCDEGLWSEPEAAKRRDTTSDYIDSDPLFGGWRS